MSADMDEVLNKFLKLMEKDRDELIRKLVPFTNLYVSKEEMEINPNGMCECCGDTTPFRDLDKNLECGVCQEPKL